MARAVSSLRPGAPRQCFRPPRFKTNASVQRLGRLGKSKDPRLRPNIGMRFEVPLGSIAARALAHQTGQAVVVANPATEVRGTPIKGQRWNPPEFTRCRETT